MSKVLRVSNTKTNETKLYLFHSRSTSSQYSHTLHIHPTPFEMNLIYQCIPLFIKSLATVGRHTLLVGGAGTGKTALVQHFMSGLDDVFSTCTINMSYYTESASLQVEIENPIEKRSGKIFGPPPGKKLVFFVDDLNLPYIEEYGTQNSHSLLTQHLCYGNFYDREDLSLKKELVDTQYVSAMNPTSGSFTVCERLQRHFSVLCCIMPGSADLTTIFQSILAGHLATFGQDVQDLTAHIVEASIVRLRTSIQAI